MSDDHDIHIEVRSEYLAQQSAPDHSRYAFAYHVRIENRGKLGATLLSRHWLITDGNHETQEVRGDGVIGEQPLIPAGQHYEYSSGAMLTTPVGSMTGSYQMRDEAGEKFDARIPIFTLAQPRLLN
ncbi:ApaG protein [gamma proteobacterium HdN1]|nr:ApaG protein [gamma proteobacterium HdN1]